MLAFDAEDGTLLWKGHTLSFAHASPVKVMLGGVSQILFQADRRLISVAPEDGRLLWSLANNGLYTTPVASGDLLVAPEHCKGVLRVSEAVGEWTIATNWTSPNFAPGWAMPVVKDGYVYAMCVASGSGVLKCLRLSDGSPQWSTNGFGFGKGSVILAGSRLVVMDDTGSLNLANATPESYQLLARCRPLTNTCYNLPAVVDGQIYVRNELGCAAIGPMYPVRASFTMRPPGKLALKIGVADNTPLDSTRRSRIRVQSAKVLRTNTVWTAYGGKNEVADGALYYIDLPAAPTFFKVFETNAP